MINEQFTVSCFFAKINLVAYKVLNPLRKNFQKVIKIKSSKYVIRK